VRVFVKSFGCSTNQADGAILAGCLAGAGHEMVATVSDAELVVYNTCAVKGPTEDRMIEICRRVPEGKRLVVAGCLPLINFERLLREVKFDGVGGPALGEKIVELVNGVVAGERVFSLHGSLHSKPALTLPRVQQSSVVSVVPISYGCLGSCAYCCTVLARGYLRSYTVQEIVERVTEDVGRGFREFWLTSQDTAAYGRDIGTNLAELLGFLCDADGDLRVRVGMMTPNMAMDILDGLVDVFRDKRIFKFVHLPVQSGDDRILGQMRRSYSVDDFKKVVDTFRRRFPELAVATDVICGFPSEDREAFGRTLRLIEDVKPDVVNVSKFFARPNTAAAGMHADFVSPSEINRRSSVAGAYAKRVALERNRQWIRWNGEIFIDEVGKVSGSWVGRNIAYKPVVVMSAENLLGEALNATVTNAFTTYLEGEIVE
jgi:threonylcarbamoyladenosine tRNA methylthiotransferase CDKAL1